ncbi:MAG TPA: aminoacyl-tRNA hydrolase [Firmicutes bacterium]|nr:aminoacyl-tRNA hydrolase [Bacillota bacterium]
MFLLVGLGNPGIRYVHTRHNAGFLVIDELASRLGVRLKEIKFESYFTRTTLAQADLLLAKPLTYMNRSGVAVAGLFRYFAIDVKNLLLIYDDMDLPLGKIRLRPGGGSGGHRGIGSVIYHLGCEQFPRLRLGIDRGKGKDAADRKEQVVSYVLSPFRPEEEDIFLDTVQKAADAVETFLQKGIEEAMNKFNAGKLGGP